MLCPYCLREVNQFTQANPDAGSIGYACPACSETVPLRYVRDYGKYPPVVFSLVGLPGHGKTVYLASLLYELERIGMEWPEFSYTPLDEEGMRVVREKQRALEAGHLPESTRKVFPRPVILRLEGMPDLGRWHLLVYDTAGEAFQRVSELKQYAGYVSRSKTVVWLVSLQDLPSPTDLGDFLTRYVQGVLEMGGDPKEQTLLVVMTKGDELVRMEGTPAGMQRFLTGEEGESNPAGLSQEMEGWMEQQGGYRNFVRRARREFGQIEYTIVSALGSAPQGQAQLVSVAPRGVLVPLQRVVGFKRGMGPEQYRQEKEEAEQQGQAEEAPRRQEKREQLRRIQAGLCEECGRPLGILDKLAGWARCGRCRKVRPRTFGSDI